MDLNNKQAKINLEQFLAHKQRRNPIFYSLYGILRLIIIIIQNIYIITSYFILSWILFLPFLWLKDNVYRKLENYLYNSLLFIVSSWSISAGLSIVEAGDDFKPLIEGEKYLTNSSYESQKQKHSQNGDLNSEYTDKNFDLTEKGIKQVVNGQKIYHHCNGDALTDASICYTPKRLLLICNHISTADVPLLMQALSPLSKQNLLWILDAQFKLTNFGLVSWSHGDFFIAKNKFVDGSLKEHLQNHPERNLIVLFPEGGFWRKRIEGSNRYAKKNNFPITKYVTHPRFGAFKDLMDPSLNITHIVDATLLYKDLKNPISILDIITGWRKEAAVIIYKVYDMSSTVVDEEWLRNIWLEKDKLLHRYYTDGNSVYEQIQDSLRIIRLDWVKLIIVHLLYILTFYLLALTTRKVVNL